MKIKWVKLILAASLALNVAFIAPFVYRNCFPDDTGKTEPSEKVSEQNIRLSLNKAQKKQVHTVIKTFRMDMMEYKRDILAKRIDIIDELGNPEFDEETLTTRTNELNELENKLNHLFVTTMVEIAAILESEQRLNFLYRLSRNWFFI
ncbi:MAG: periplasmic heavy metal sensor, partial [bacterium]|nr:periplasmic heavy metal sensor [bacterium]